jgi:hypothetical protein
MKKIISLLLILLINSILAYEFKPFGEYTPWYTGPILATSAYNLDPGSFNVQPYLYVLDSYGFYQSSWSMKKTATTLSINPTCYLQTGITKWMDITVNIQALYKKEKSNDSLGYADTNVQLGFQLLRENHVQPALRLLISELFPTGKYQKLSSHKNGVDSRGSGSYHTIFGLCASKVLYWLDSHPMQVRLNANYSLPTNVSVKGFNSYGGGFGTNGTVKPGHVINGIFSLEFSFTQSWVFATDVLYTYSTKTRFSGTEGLNSNGTVASNSSGESDQWSLTPSLEYNFNENFGLILGSWFTVKGKNSSDFAGGVFSLTYTW